MIRLIEKSIEDRVWLHKQLEPTMFSSNPDHWPRLKMTRRYIAHVIELCGGRPIIYEFGCAGLDLCGKLTPLADVYGVECNEKYAPLAAKRHPDAKFILGNVETFTPHKVDILVLCEILEHLVNPQELVRRLFPLAKYAVVSHPLNEKSKLAKVLEEEQHYWGFTKRDFKNWFERNNYTLLKMRTGWSIILGIGRNENRCVLDDEKRDTDSPIFSPSL